MRKSALLIALLFGLGQGCGGSQTPAPESPKGAAGEAAGDTSGTASGSAAAASAKTAASAADADVSGQIVGTVTLDSIDSILAQGTSLVKPQLPPAFQAMANPMVLKAQFFAMIKAPELETVLDTGRPMALAVADPKTYEGKGLGPVMVAIPIKDPNGLIDFLAKKAKGHETGSNDVHKFMMDQDALYLSVHEGTYALLASNETLITGAAKVLGPLVQGKPGHLAHLRINMAEVYKRFGKEIDRALAKIEKELNEKPLGKVNTGGRMITRWMGYVKEMRVIDVALGLKGNDIMLETALAAKSGSGFSKHMTKLNAGKPWGLKYVPAESGFAVVSRSNPELMMQDFDDGVAALSGILKQWVPAATIDGWRDAARESIKHFAGAGSGGMYATANGGIGFASATKLKDGKAARESTRKWMLFLAKEVDRLVDKTFRKEIDKVLPGAKLSIKVSKNRMRAGGAKGDLYEIKFKWPRLKDKKQKEMMGKVKKGLTKVFGKSLKMGFVVVDDTGLMTFGKDYKKRMGELVAVAKGKKGPSSLVKKLAPYTAGRDVFMVVYAPLEVLAEQVLRVADKVTTIPPKVRDAMAKVMPGPDTEVPLTFVASQKGETITFESSISANLVGMLARGAMHAMTMRSKGP